MSDNKAKWVLDTFGVDVRAGMAVEGVGAGAAAEGQSPYLDLSQAEPNAAAAGDGQNPYLDLSQGAGGAPGAAGGQGAAYQATTYSDQADGGVGGGTAAPYTPDPMGAKNGGDDAGEGEGGAGEGGAGEGGAGEGGAGDAGIGQPDAGGAPTRAAMSSGQHKAFMRMAELSKQVNALAAARAKAEVESRKQSGAYLQVAEEMLDLVDATLDRIGDMEKAKPGSAGKLGEALTPLVPQLVQAAGGSATIPGALPVLPEKNFGDYNKKAAALSARADKLQGEMDRAPSDHAEADRLAKEIAAVKDEGVPQLREMKKAALASLGGAGPMPTKRVAAATGGASRNSRRPELPAAAEWDEEEDRKAAQGQEAAEARAGHKAMAGAKGPEEKAEDQKELERRIAFSPSSALESFMADKAAITEHWQAYATDAAGMADIDKWLVRIFKRAATLLKQRQQEESEGKYLQMPEAPADDALAQEEMKKAEEDEEARRKAAREMRESIEHAPPTENALGEAVAKGALVRAIDAMHETLDTFLALQTAREEKKADVRDGARQAVLGIRGGLKALQEQRSTGAVQQGIKELGALEAFYLSLARGKIDEAGPGLPAPNALGALNERLSLGLDDGVLTAAEQAAKGVAGMMGDACGADAETKAWDEVATPDGRLSSKKLTELTKVVGAVPASRDPVVEKLRRKAVDLLGGPIENFAYVNVDQFKPDDRKKPRG